MLAFPCNFGPSAIIVSPIIGPATQTLSLLSPVLTDSPLHASPMAAATAPPPAAAIAATFSALLRRRTVRPCYARCVSSNARAEAAEPERRSGGLTGTRLEEAVPAGEGRSRVDAWISARLGGGGVSRARVQASIRAGLVAVNGRPVSKVSWFSSL